MARSLLSLAPLALCSLLAAAGCAAASPSEDLASSESAWVTEDARGIALSVPVLMTVEAYDVAAIELNCRAGAGTKFDVVDTVKDGDWLHAVDRGPGKERVRFSADNEPWLRVQTDAFHECYVAASYEYIRPSSLSIPLPLLDATTHYLAFGGSECRVAPRFSAPLASTYPKEDTITVALAQGHPSYSYGNGKPWIQTDRNCWVLAAFTFIQPWGTGEEIEPSLIDR